MTEAAHPVFAQAPIRGDISLSVGPCPVPYHIYDGHGVLITGDGDAAALAPIFADQDVFQVLGAGGAAQLGLFVCQFTAASLGPHLEAHLVALASPTSGARVAEDPYAMMAALGTRPDWGLLSLHLWNDTDRVLAYNSEYLGLQAHRITGHVTLDRNAVQFDFATDTGPLLTGQLHRAARSDARAMWRFLRLMGLRKALQAGRQRQSESAVINRKCAVLPDNRRARTLCAPDRMVVQALRPDRDDITLHDPQLAPYCFAPKVMQHLSPFRFVYLHPDDG